MDVKQQHQLAQLERLKKSADNVNREIDRMERAAELAHNIRSFRSQRQLARARDKLEDAWLLIMAAEKNLPKKGDADDSGEEEGGD